MPADPHVIAAIETAVAANPENDALRLHLSELLTKSERWDEALEQAVIVLARQPDSPAALRAAINAGEPLEEQRVKGWRRLLHAIDDPLQPASGKTAESLLPPLTMGPAPAETDTTSETDRYESEDPTVMLADVAGMENVKRRLQVAFLGPMKNPEMRAMYGKSLRGGLLLYGPPGCGKTFIARAVAGELGARFITVGLSDVLDMYVGQSERNLRAIFEQARRSRPCVLFFDEIDALGRKRSLRRESATRDVVNQLLSELDSVNADNEGLFVLAATNHPWDVDAALRRPGRLDRTLLVLPPDESARAAILTATFRARPLSDQVNFNEIARRTDGYSGADMVHLGEAATEHALEESLRTGTIRPIGPNDFKNALKEVRPSVGSWLETARNYVLFANEGGVYDDLATYLRERKLL